MEYRRFNPSACGFRQTHLPLTPQFGIRDLLPRRRSNAFRSAGSGVRPQFCVRGRYALLESDRRAGVGPGGSLLASNVTDLRRRLDALPHPVRALLLPHFFSFHRSCAEVMRLCRERGVALVEDCSHRLVTGPSDPGSETNLPPGPAGHWKVARPHKFFACHEGGLLWGRGGDIRAEPPLPPFRQREQRELLRAGAGARRFKGAPSGGPIGPALQASAGAPLSADCDGLTDDDHVSPAFVPREARPRGAPLAQRIIQSDDVHHLARRRQRHCLCLMNRAAGLPHCGPLVAGLPAGMVPFIFPLHRARPAAHFHRLKYLGVPVGRWHELAVSDCAVAAEFRLHVMHLPRHQSLTDAGMEWMCAAIAQVLTLPESWPCA